MFNLFVVYISTTVLILLGNSLTIAAICKNPKLNTASNQFILGLAIADLLVGFTILPYFYNFDVANIFANDVDYGSFQAYSIECLLTRIPLLLACISSYIHLAAISVDRCYSLLEPLKHKAFFTKRKAWKVISFIWIVSSVTVSVPIFLNNRDQDCEAYNFTYFSCPDCLIQMIAKDYFDFVLAPMFTFLTIIILAAHFGIYKVAVANTEDAKKPLIVIAIIVGCFFVCWIPFLIFLRVMLDLWANLNLWNIFVFFSVPPLLNSLLNPVIYAWKMKEFRHTELEIFKSIFRCRLIKIRSPEAVPNEFDPI